MQVVENATNSINKCEHCANECKVSIYDDLGHRFCCRGCLSVFQVIHENNLQKYYQIKNAQPFTQQEKIDFNSNDYSFFASDEFEQDYTVKDDKLFTIKLFLEGVHCSACIWLLESLPSIIDGVVRSKLDFGKSLLVLSYRPEKVRAIELASKIASFGYHPRPIKNLNELNDIAKSSETIWLVRIAVAVVAMMNIMIYAISNYAGAELFYASIFNWINWIFITPVVFFSAVPFYKSAASSLKFGHINMDVPISMAIISAYLHGSFNTFNHVDYNYFDSISMLVFLLLFSRFIVKKAQSESLDLLGVESLVPKKMYPIFQSTQSKLSHNILLNDEVIVSSGEIIPIDGVILRGNSWLNMAALTGESDPVFVRPGSFVFAGASNLDEEIIVKASCNSDETKISQMLEKISLDSSHAAPISTQANRWAKYFSLSTVILASCVAIYFYRNYGIAQALKMFITLMVIACPCALALATPLAFKRCLSLAAKFGIFIKDNETIEKISKVENIFFDKTGTLTYGEFSVQESISYEDHNQLFHVVYTLESRSRHPVAISLTKYAQNHIQSETAELSVRSYKEINSSGVEGIIDGQCWCIKKIDHNHEANHVGVYCDGQLVHKFVMKDVIREDSECIVQRLLNNEYKLNIISGDQKQNVTNLFRKNFNSKLKMYGELLPDNKAKIIECTPNSMMVGDGVNDALALSRAFVGVAVKGSVDISLKTASIYMTKSGIAGVEVILTLAKETMSVVRRNLYLSLSYNIIGVLLAIFLGIGPLGAAILMPISSLTVVVSTLWGSRKIREMKRKVS